MRLKTLALITLVTIAPAFADEGAMDYRHHTMEAIGGHTSAFFDILQGKVAHSEHLALHANALAELAVITDTLFPEGSAGGDALPAIWENPEDFAMRVAEFEEAAAGLRDTIAEDGSIGPAAQALGQACKGCHDSYREE